MMPSVGLGLYRYASAGVLLGFGLALLQSFKGHPGPTLKGAILIDLCGAGSLGIWLLLTPSAPVGSEGLILWALRVIILGLTLVDFSSRPRDQNGRGSSATALWAICTIREGQGMARPYTCQRKIDRFDSCKMRDSTLHVR